MRILHISAAHESTGAGYAAYNLHINLCKKGFRSDILFINSSQEHTISYETNFFRRLKRFLFTKIDRLILFFYLKKRNIYFSPGIIGLDLKKYISFASYDIVHLHWVNHGFVDVNLLTEIDIPIIWTMHDFWPITGGCHYFYDCYNFKNSCGKCTILGSNRKSDFSSYSLKRKLSIYEQLKTRLTLVPISDWVRDIALSSPVAEHSPIHGVIYSGIDTVTFRFFDLSFARKILGLQLSTFYILLGATDLANPAKGISYAIEALNHIIVNKGFEFKILVFGETNDPFFDSDLVVNLGYIKDKEKLALVYASSNLLISPSINEAFGMLMAEAQCVGCPVVAFDDFGPRNIVNHKTTGYLSKVFDVDSLVDGIEFIYNNSFDRIQISSDSITKFNIQNSVNEYSQLYNKVLGL
jgi:glycosyltransferase involved in cell wall biosynthesis